MTFSKAISVIATVLLSSCADSVARYGSNAGVGKTFIHDGIRLYYEVYGAGEPLLLVHGNGGSIGNFRAQIDYFRTHYKVIAMDSRDHGKSGDSADKLTYEKMADDLAALLDVVGIERVNVVGWSDGGVEALLLGIHHPSKVNKIVTMGATLRPGEQAAYPDIVAVSKASIDSMPASVRETPAGRRELKITQLIFDEPHIEDTQLQAITAPTLIMASDHDLVRDEHTLEIYHNVPKSQLCILPNSTHMVPFDDPVLFNATVERFLRTSFVAKDRVRDFLSSFQTMQTER